ncbi:SDR family oxidoreductase [Nocardioides sp. zg-ZUI104]|uniref:SDR family oxidoreductase n=1 Tax=Nocardioides faecalis TaxID=2803858 RepID=UPI001BD1B059|nr:SDR family oxidoreductase [Nocardioides faecalis]MBS4752480.1 SDR family oxidoreductase [Nocardioides faecalis]
MGTYAVTGSASGMGAAVVDRLRSDGHTVLTVDIKDAEVVADLSTPTGRGAAAREVLERCEGRLDGAVLAAGIGPAPGADRPQLILEVNFLGVVDLLEAWRPALAAAGNAKVVVFSSNSTTTVPLIARATTDAIIDRDMEKALRRIRLLGAKMAPSFAYGASKIAVSHWVRRHAVTREWAGAGIRLNAIAPGAILTPLLQQQLATPAEAKRIKAFPVPIGGFGDPDHLARWVTFMLSDAADFLCGSIIFVDGGSDAWFRASDWPRSLSARRVPGYMRRMRSFRPYPPTHGHSDHSG